MTPASLREPKTFLLCHVTCPSWFFTTNRGIILIRTVRVSDTARSLVDGASTAQYLHVVYFYILLKNQQKKASDKKKNHTDDYQFLQCLKCQSFYGHIKSYCSLILPDVSNAVKPITLRHVLNHVSLLR